MLKLGLEMSNGVLERERGLEKGVRGTLQIMPEGLALGAVWAGVVNEFDWNTVHETVGSYPGSRFLADGACS